MSKINYTIWSDIFICPICGTEIVFWDAAVDQAAGKVSDVFPCPRCNAEQSKRTLQRAWEMVYDRSLNQTIRRVKQKPVLINYSIGKKRYEKTPDTADLALGNRIEEEDIPHWFPTNTIPKGDKTSVKCRPGVYHRWSAGAYQ